ncbi:MAG TPA: type II secretion system protein [Desulfobaccales bacterium]
MDLRRKQQAGLTLTELVCVMAIILILMALYLPAIARVYKRVVTFLGGMSGWFQPCPGAAFCACFLGEDL